MKALRITHIIGVLAVVLLTACHSLPDYDNTARGTFDALWTELDHHYCFFEQKQIDWNAVRAKYEPQVSSNMSRQSLFRVLEAMLDELRDGHVNLSSPFATSYYREWWADYPQNFDERLIQQYYFNFNYTSLGAVTYGLLPQNIGYIHWPSFEYSIGAGNIDYILSMFSICPALILDIRNNPGGDLTNADDLAAHFTAETRVAGYICHKTGPGHNDFSEPFAIELKPLGSKNLAWTKPVILLTNRSTFSAANYFTAVMKSLPNVVQVGATTGGGAGMPYSLELPNGWGVRFSACPIYDSNMKCTEFGIAPDDRYAVDMDPLDALAGQDTILDFAISLITSNQL